jgi:hypothetical protein
MTKSMAKILHLTHFSTAILPTYTAYSHEYHVREKNPGYQRKREKHKCAVKKILAKVIFQGRIEVVI